MDLRLTGKTAVVTGGSAGIGLACARALCAEGVRVLITARDGERLARAEASLGGRAGPGGAACALAADLNRPEDVRRVVAHALERFPRIDILINSAGVARAGAFAALEDGDFQAAWNLKLLGAIRMVRAVVPSMIAQGDGRIVTIVGAAGRTPSSTFLPGSTANAALLNFTRGIARELAPHGIRINAISPGPTATERAERLTRQTAHARGLRLEEVRAETTGRIPLGRLVTPEEVADLAIFLVSDRAASITGAEVLIDGGGTPGV
jgi:NAD(P)-dependent dehydrogenase (short-subunit alcohol dehydrogenase family)